MNCLSFTTPGYKLVVSCLSISVSESCTVHILCHYTVHSSYYASLYIAMFICRPIVGFTNICVNRAFDEGIEQLRSILTHEITHALVSW